MKTNKITCDCRGCDAYVEDQFLEHPKGWMRFSGSIALNDGGELVRSSGIIPVQRKTISLYFCPDCHNAKADAIREESIKPPTADEEMLNVMRAFVEEIVQENMEI